MYFSNKVDEELRGWMIHDTWDTGHPLDQARFFMFARALAGLAQKVDVGDVEAKLKIALKEFHPNLVVSRFASTLEKYAAKAEIILAYEKAPALLRR